MKRPPNPHNNSKIIMEFDTDKCDKDEKQWVHSNSIVKQKGMLILQVRVKADRLVKTTKKKIAMTVFTKGLSWLWEFTSWITHGVATI